MLLASLALSAASVAPAAFAQAAATVGVLYPIKTMLGQQGRRGAELAAEMINASGGVLGGQPLKLIIYDDNYSPADAVAAARKLASEDKVSVIVGATNTAVALAVMQVAKQNNMLFMAAVTKAPQITDYDRGFRFNPLVSADGEAFNKYLRDQVKAQRIAVVVENGDYGRSTVARHEGGPRRQGGGHRALRARQADRLQHGGQSREGVQPRRGVRRLLAARAGRRPAARAERGRHQRQALPAAGQPLAAVHPGWRGPPPRASSRRTSGLPRSPTRPTASSSPPFQAKYKEVPGKVDFLGFESMWVLGQAVRKAGTLTDTAKLAATLRENAWDSPRGEIRFPNNQATASRIVTLTVKGGQILVAD